MKKQIHYLLMPLAAMLLLTACRKDQAHEQFIPDEETVIPDVSKKITASVAGFVVDEANLPLGRVQVFAGAKNSFTDEYGYFLIENTDLGEAAAVLTLSLPGYFTSYKSFTAQEGQQSFLRIQMLPLVATGTIDASAGGIATNTDGSTVNLPANGVVVAASGTAYTGSVNIAARYLDPVSTTDFYLNAPGDGRALDKDGKLKYANSFGILAVELTGSNGQRLQIAPGKQATITIPISASMAGTAPAEILLWSLDENTGFWKEEGRASRSGNSYVGTVSHFSFWQGAEPLQLVNLTARILDASLQPLVNVAVVVTPADQPANAGHGRFAFTDADGYVNGPVLANRNLRLEVATPCALPVYAHTFTTTSSDKDLGAITGNTGQALVTISGTALNCSNGPVTDGYVQLYDNGFYNRIAVENGSFSFSVLSCSNAPVYYVLVDKSTNMQSAPQSISLVPGQNNLGALTACSISTISTISYTIDGVTTTVSEPSLEPVGILAGQNIWTQVLVFGGDQNTNPDISFQFDGGNTIGDGHRVQDIFSKGFESKRGFAPVPLKINITEFGNPGGFISGSFSGLVLDFVSNAQHDFSCEFRIRRYR